MTMLLQEFSAGGVWSSFKHCRLEVGWGWSGKGKTIPSGRGTSDFGGEGDGTPLQYSCLENSMDGGAWKAAVHGVTKGRTRLRDFTFTFHFHALEKEMATHSSTLAWKIPWMDKPGRLQSMGSLRVGHD